MITRTPTLKSWAGTWVLAAVLIACFPLLMGVTAAHAATPSTHTAKALDYLHARQTSEGGFADQGKAASDAVTAWGVVAIAAAGEDPNAWVVNGKSPVDYLARQSASWRQTTDVARTALAAIAAGRDPSDFGGIDLIERLKAAEIESGADAGRIGPYVNSHIWAMLALDAAGSGSSARHVTWLVEQQNDDGGWGWATSVASDSNDTAAALQALIAAGESSASDSVKRGLRFLKTCQTSGGGIAYTPGGAADANSTAWAMQALVACGKDPSDWQSGGGNPGTALAGLQGADGAVSYTTSQKSNPLLVTEQALPAFAGRPFPVAFPKNGSVRAWRPTIVPSWPKAGASVVAGAGAALKFVVADGAGCGVGSTGLTVVLDGAKAAASLSGEAGTVPISSLRPGVHKVSVTATDRAGNRTTLSGWDFTVVAATGAQSSATTASVLSTQTPGSGAATAPGSSAGATAPSSHAAAPRRSVNPEASGTAVMIDSGTWTGGPLVLGAAGFGLLVMMLIAAAIHAYRQRSRRPPAAAESCDGEASAE